MQPKLKRNLNVLLTCFELHKITTYNLTRNAIMNTMYNIYTSTHQTKLGIRCHQILTISSMLEQNTILNVCTE